MRPPGVGMRRVSATVVAALMLAHLCGPAMADIVYLKNGNTQRGKVIAETETSVTVKLPFGEVTYTRDEVFTVEKDEMGYVGLSSSQDAAADAPVSETTGEPLTVDEEKSYEECIAALESDDEAAVKNALDNLLAMGPKVVPQLISTLAKSNKPATSVYVMDALAKIDPKRAVAPIAAKSSDEQELTRQAAVVMLGEVKSTNATPALVDRLADKKYFVRRDAVLALGSVKDRRAIPSLVRAVGDNSKEVREAARKSLATTTDLKFKTNDEWKQWWATESQKKEWTSKPQLMPKAPPPSAEIR